MALTRQKLSASLGGSPISLATSAPSTIHTSTTAAGASDETHLWVSNVGALTTVAIYVGTTGEGDKIVDSVPGSSGMYLMVPGLYLASGLILYGTAGTTGVVAYGFVNRLTTGA